MSSIAKPIVGRWEPNLVWLLYVAGLAPAVYNFYLGTTGVLGADPVNTFELFLGLWAVRFLILTLAVSPLREIFGVNLIRYRRALGLLCFYYALMHFLTYLVLDQRLMLSAVLADVTKRPFIMMGAAALVLLVPLALTSNAFSIRRIGQASSPLCSSRWRRERRADLQLEMLLEVKPNTAITFNAAGSTLQGKRGLVVGIAPAPIVNTSCNRIGAFTNCTSY